MFKKNLMEFFVRLVSYLYYFYSSYITNPWSHVLLEYSVVTWPLSCDSSSHTIYISTPLYILRFWIKYLNTWETISFLELL